MNKKERLFIYLIGLQVYIFLIIYNFVKRSQWIFDNLLAIIFLTSIFLLSEWILLDKMEFILCNIALLMHNLGSFNFYSWSWGVVQYDNIVHFTSSIVASYIIFDFLSKKLHIKENQMIKKTVVDEHKVIFVMLVIACVAMLGTIVELMEFGGFVFFGEGDGLLFTGAGDGEKFGDPFYQYSDTMTDIMVNTLGSITGVLIYYYSRYKKALDNILMQPYMKIQTNIQKN